MYKKYVRNGYIIGLGAGEEISREEYDHILTVIQSRPEAPNGYSYALKENLEWKLTELPVIQNTDEEEI